MSHKTSINEILSSLEEATRKAMRTASGRSRLLTRTPDRFRSLAKFVTEYGKDQDFQDFLDTELDELYLSVEYPLEDDTEACFSQSGDPEGDLDEIRELLETASLDIRDPASMPEVMALQMVISSGRNIDAARSEISDDDMAYFRMRLQDVAPTSKVLACSEQQEKPELICCGSLMSGPDIDPIKASGLALFDEEIEAIYNDINARDLLLECECIDEDEQYGEDWAPGMSDSYFKYYAPSKFQFERELRAVLLEKLSV